MPEPASWPRFRSKLRALAPASPLAGEGATSGLATATGAVSTAATFTDAAMSGAGQSLPTGTGAVIGVADAAANRDFGAGVVAVADEVVSWGVGRIFGGMSGTFVTGLLMVVRGTHASLERSDAITSYLLDLGGYVTTLVRSAQRARAGGSDAIVIPPLPSVPAFVEESGSLYSRFNREAYMAGYARVGTLAQWIDEHPETAGDRPSRECFRYLAEQAGVPASRDHMLRTRDRAEDYIAGQLLGVDRRALSERLRRWAMTG